MTQAKEKKVHGIFADSNWGGLEISVVDGTDYLYWRENYGTRGEWHRAKIKCTCDSRLFFVARGRRVHLDCVLRV